MTRVMIEPFNDLVVEFRDQDGLQITICHDSRGITVQVDETQGGDLYEREANLKSFIAYHNTDAVLEPEEEPDNS